jgi:pilus assembly protein Flp/PilA
VPARKILRSHGKSVLTPGPALRQCRGGGESGMLICFIYKAGRNDLAEPKIGESAMFKFVTKFARKEEGLTTVEYAIAGTLVAVAVVAAFRALGVQVGVSINNIIAALTGG